MEPGGLIVLVALFVGFWLLVIRPQRRRAQEQRMLHESVAVGDEIVTLGGLLGRVKAIDETDDIDHDKAPTEAGASSPEGALLGDVAPVHVEPRHIGLRNVPNLLECGHEPLREERVPVGSRLPLIDDTESVIGGTGSVGNQPVRCAGTVIHPAEFLLYGVVLVDSRPRKSQNLTDSHWRILIP